MRGGLALAALLSAACAAPPKPEAAPPRITDSVPERAAALRSASHLDQPVEENRWGIESAAERKRNEAAAASGSSTTVMIPLPPMDGGASPSPDARGPD